ncbi:acylphosphatase acyP, partial [Mycobacterium tuberculosis T17]
MSAPDVRLTAWVHGWVQGVGFRWWTRCRALDLRLTGTRPTTQTDACGWSPRVRALRARSCC